MTSEKPRHDAFLAAIEAKIAAWTAVADTYRAAASIDGPLGDVDVSTTGAQAAHPKIHSSAKATDLPVGIFRDKTVKDAVVIYLGAGRRQQSNKDIATGLKNGGIVTTATNFEATVSTALYRLKEEGTVLRFPDGWDLAASYPENLRARLEKDKKPRQTRTTKAKAAKHPRRSAKKQSAQGRTIVQDEELPSQAAHLRAV